MNNSLMGKHALVTGASRGLGLEIARQLAGAGAHLAVLARDVVALEAASTSLRDSCVDSAQVIRSYVLDLENDQQIEQAVGRCINDFAHIDILINNAGI